MSNLLEKISKNRTRPAEIEGEKILVKVYSEKELIDIARKTGKYSENKMAEFLADQFLHEDGEKIFTAEWLKSEACTNVFTVELVKLLQEVNSGTYKKKEVINTLKD